MTIHTRFTPILFLAGSLPISSPAEEVATLPTLYIDARQTANLQPVSTYRSPVSNLEFEPRIDLHSRNMAEAQGDVTIRGGIFEATGFRIGSATLIDPQTGHYSAELPIAPEMLTGPTLLVGTDNALYGFNSTVGTIHYDWSRIQDGGSLTVAGGDHNLNLQRIHHSLTAPLQNSEDWTLGVEAELSRSENNGTIRHGDHHFERNTARIQILGPGSQTDLFAGYQSKLFGWPGMYTANPAFLETENLKTRLFLLNHVQNYSDGNYLELTAYHRRHNDHYILTRNNPTLYQAFHETKVSGLALAGMHRISEPLAIRYSAQFIADKIDSTSLIHGRFNSRSYGKLSLLPEYEFLPDEDDSLTVRLGATFDDTNRNDSEISGLFDISRQYTDPNGDTDTIYLSFSETSQVIGYTAIASNPRPGLFGGNPDLDRETSQNLEMGVRLSRDDWSFESAIFYRWDDDLTDWTFNAGTPNSRSANPVDIETFGFELIGTKRFGTIEAIAGYTYLDKREDYGNTNVDASFYALNYPNHRFTLGAIWRPSDRIEFRMDNEWRKNEDNALRNGSDSALLTSLGISLFFPEFKGLELFFSLENAWEDDFEDVPGTPGRGDQYSLGATFRW